MIDTVSGKSRKKTGVGGDCFCIDFSPDGGRLAVTCANHIAYLDAASNQRLLDVPMGKLGSLKSFHAIRDRSLMLILADRSVADGTGWLLSWPTLGRQLRLFQPLSKFLRKRCRESPD